VNTHWVRASGDFPGRSGKRGPNWKPTDIEAAPSFTIFYVLFSLTCSTALHALPQSRLPAIPRQAASGQQKYSPSQGPIEIIEAAALYRQFKTKTYCTKQGLRKFKWPFMPPERFSQSNFALQHFAPTTCCTKHVATNFYADCLFTPSRSYTNNIAHEKSFTNSSLLHQFILQLQKPENQQALS